MSKNSNRPNNEFPVFAGILLGMVMGLALAGVIAWFMLKKNPVPVPVAKEPVAAAKPSVQPEIPGNTKPGAAGTASGNGENKARFEFYKELTDKPDTAKKLVRRETALAKPLPLDTPPENTSTYFLQEGAYTNMEDAEKVKAKLALLGIVANVQPAIIPDKGLWYRVRMGPYKNSTEMNESLAALKQNGIKAVPVKVK